MHTTLFFALVVTWIVGGIILVISGHPGFGFCALLVAASAEVKVSK